MVVAGRKTTTHYSILNCLDSNSSPNVMTLLHIGVGRSALMVASQNGHTETVNMLLEHGAEVHLTDKVRNRIT